MTTQQTARTQYVKAANGVTFAYRKLGTSNDKTPLVMHIHFRANMDFWDPLLVNSIAETRPVIVFDQSGVGRSDGAVATTYQGWADNVIALVEALRLHRIDLFGFSMGGYCVQMVALTAPHLIRKLIIAGSGPSTPMNPIKGIIWPREEAPSRPIKLLSTAHPESREETEKAIAISFFPDTEAGRTAAREYFSRIYSRTAADDGKPLRTLLSLEKSRAQRKAAMDWHKPNPTNSFHRLGELKMPVLIANGDEDLLIPTSHSWELLRGIENAQLIVYPKAGHGFLWQYAARFARDVIAFLDEESDQIGKPRL